MAFLDELTFYARAGKGGDGVVRWRHEKYKEFMGPAGGDGGKGGDVYALGVRDIGILAKLAHTRIYKAENGIPGGNNSRTGRDGEDFIIPLPIGSVITNKSTHITIELLHEDEKILLLKGGAGGYGNERFKGPSNVRPEEHTPGKMGEEADFYVELQLIADAGLIGLPNAGKSSLLNALTRAEAKVGEYAFTTLDPNLGVFYGHVIADIPGLIEGASEGRGLGYKFLRHIRRTNLLLHCISAERDDPIKDHKIIRKELSIHEGLTQKREIIVITKTDTVSQERVQELVSLFKKYGYHVCAVSILDDASVKAFGEELTQELSEG